MNKLPSIDQITPFKRLVSITASGTPFNACRGIFIDTAGSFTIQFEEASAPVTISLPVGTHPFSILLCTAGTGLWAGY